jgi:hypothetical protein
MPRKIKEHSNSLLRYFSSILEKQDPFTSNITPKEKRHVYFSLYYEPSSNDFIGLLLLQKLAQGQI